MRPKEKRIFFSFKKITKLIALLITASFFLSACNNDDDDATAGPAPSITLTSEGTSNTPGATVSTTVNIDAPEGIKSLSILKNGVVTETITNFNNQTTATYDHSYVVEDLAEGTVVNFTYIVSDNLDRTSAPKTFAVTVSAVPSREIVEVIGDPDGNAAIQGDVTWTKDKIYRLQGFVRVGSDRRDVSGNLLSDQQFGTLTIEPGTLIIGDRETKGTLVVQRGSRIIARGTAEEPIIMTSERAVGQREAGDWGGLVICGHAGNNQGPNIQLEGGYGAWHGGNNDDDDSGIIEYVRIEYAGTPINPNEEVNSLTMGSVGRGTLINNVQCSYGLDDAFEWFGGTVNATNLIAYRGLDDDFDVDFGYRGNVQFGLAIRASTLADQSGSNGFEVDNDGAGQLIEPYTSAVFSNITVIGPKRSAETAIQAQFQNAAHLRRSNKIKIYNSFLTAFPNGIFIDGTSTQAHAAAGDLQLRNVVVAGVDGWGNNGFGGSATNNNAAVRNFNTATPNAPITIGAQTPEEWFLTPDFNNKIYPKYQDVGLDAGIFESGAPVLTAPSGLLGEARWDNTPVAGEFFEQVDFIGAFGAENWTEGWTEWNPGIADYR
ncbi:hypothetical protein BH23BAC1_BH23BAC1_07980 [soil metagenome]